MNSFVKRVTRFSILLCVALLPLAVYGGPIPPPPPEGIPFDLVCGVVLAGGAIVVGRKIYSKKETA